jgi:hypothetical protein
MSAVARKVARIAGIAATISAIILGPTNPVTIALSAVAAIPGTNSAAMAIKPPKGHLYDGNQRLLRPRRQVCLPC